MCLSFCTCVIKKDACGGSWTRILAHCDEIFSSCEFYCWTTQAPSNTPWLSNTFTFSSCLVVTKDSSSSQQVDFPLTTAPSNFYAAGTPIPNLTKGFDDKRCTKDSSATCVKMSTWHFRSTFDTHNQIVSLQYGIQKQNQLYSGHNVKLVPRI